MKVKARRQSGLSTAGQLGSGAQWGSVWRWGWPNTGGTTRGAPEILRVAAGETPHSTLHEVTRVSVAVARMLSAISPSGALVC